MHFKVNRETLFYFIHHFTIKISKVVKWNAQVGIQYLNKTLYKGGQGGCRNRIQLESAY